MSETSLAHPIPVTRSVIARLQVNMSPTGRFRVIDASGQGTLADYDVPILSSIKMKFTLRSQNHCGAAILQPLGWKYGCRAELCHTLGSVEFPFLGGTGYQPWPQSQRHTTVDATYTRLSANTGVVETAVGENEEKFTTRSDIAESPAATTAKRPDGLTLLFIAFTEQGLPGGGDVEITGLVDQQGNPKVLKYPVP